MKSESITPIKGVKNGSMNSCTLEEFCVQETIGGWKQVPCFFGSYEECEEYLDWNNGNYAIVPADSYEVDYLN